VGKSIFVLWLRSCGYFFLSFVGAAAPAGLPNKFGGGKKSYYFHMVKQYLRQRAGKNDKCPPPERIW
jgi:hypothetical protein